MSTTEDDGGPAFPRFVPDGHYNGSVDFPGMALRDWMAGMVLPAAVEWMRLAGKESIFNDGYDGPHDQPVIPESDADDDCKGIARCCYAIADAMIAARKSPTP